MSASTDTNKSSTATRATPAEASSSSSAHEFTHTELMDYSIALNVILVVGIVCHLTVIVILVYQQYKRLKYNRIRREFVRVNGGVDAKDDKTVVSSATSTAAAANGLPPRSPSAGSAASDHNHFDPTSSPSRRLAKLKFSHKKYLNYNNYVTFAFVFHQSLVDLTRVVYCLLYANSLQMESMSTSLAAQLASAARLSPVVVAAVAASGLNATSSTTTTSSAGSFVQQIDGSISLFFNDMYEKYCTQMASFYSILSMVTLINILAILISETCRFYDLKLNTSDTSSCCCVLFGVLLIWISSLIIISSLMLVGVADSAAPTWRCDLGEESTTRSLVINIVWFLLVAFIILIALLYSCSLYKELSSLDYKHHRLSLYAVNISIMAFKPNANFLRHHILIVEETSKRLIILFCLIVVFCLTFLPNFLMTVLKNTLHERVALKPFNIMASIANLSNPTFNSLILLILCLKANDSFLTDDNDYDMDDIEHEPDRSSVKAYFMRVKSLLLGSAARSKYASANCSRSDAGAIDGDNDDDDDGHAAERQSVADERLACLAKPAAVDFCREGSRSRSRSRSSLRMGATVEPNAAKSASKSPRSLPRTLGGRCGGENVPMVKIKSLEAPQHHHTTNVREFYSKVGSRLGNMSVG